MALVVFVVSIRRGGLHINWRIFLNIKKNMEMKV